VGTFLYEAMATVNSRPLTTTNDPDLEPLTPNHLIPFKGRPVTQAAGSFAKEDIYSRKWWRRVQYLSAQFWSRWRKEYITNLNYRQKWNRPRRNVRTGDIVLLVEDNTPRNQWTLGKIIATHKSADGFVRKVDLLLSKKDDSSPTILQRPIQKVVVIVEEND
jgi:hypothetical protein